MGVEALIIGVAAGLIKGATAGVAAGILAGVSTFAMGGISKWRSEKAQKKLAKQQAAINAQFASKASGYTYNSNEPIASREIIYGEMRKGGSIAFLETTGSDKYLHMVLVLAEDDVHEIGEIWADDVVIPVDYFDGNGNVIAGEYNGVLRIKRHNGSEDQLADSDLVAETTADASFRGRGIAYLYIRFKYDRDKYPSGPPKISAIIKGKKLYDPRDGTKKYTANPALILYDLLTKPADALFPGLGVDPVYIDEQSFIAAANACEEFVLVNEISENITSADPNTNIMSIVGKNSRTNLQTGDKVHLIGAGVPGGLSQLTDYYVIMHQRKDNVRIKLASTYQDALDGNAIDITSNGQCSVRKIAEPRYSAGGIMQADQSPDEMIDEIISAMAGNINYIGGKWFVSAGVYKNPTYAFSESHIISSYKIRPKASRRERYNIAKGVYVSPLNDGKPSDYPVVKNALYISQDNGEAISADVPLPMTQRPHTAQRIAKIELEKTRQEILFEASFSLHAMQVKPGDTIRLSIAQMGWDQKLFAVKTWRLAAKDIDGVPLNYVQMELQETAAEIYDWNNGEETAVDPAPNTNLTNYMFVPPVTGLAATPIEVRTASGDMTYQFKITWTPPDTDFVINGGRYQVQFKETLDNVWSRSFTAEDEDIEVAVPQINPGTTYDARVRAVSSIGVRSEYASLFGINIFSPSGATFKFDYRYTFEAPYEIIDYGSIEDEPVSDLDWGPLYVEN